jgi:hypothetical protein
MVVLLVIGTLALLLTAGCIWEARTGRPQWGSPRERIDPAVRSAAKRSAGVSAATAFWMVEGGGGDGG